MMGADSPLWLCQRSRSRTGSARQEFSCAILKLFQFLEGIFIHGVASNWNSPFNSSSIPYHCHLNQLNLYLSFKLWFQCHCLLWAFSGPSIPSLDWIPLICALVASCIVSIIAITMLHCNYFCHPLLHAHFHKHRYHKCLVPH